MIEEESHPLAVEPLPRPSRILLEDLAALTVAFTNASEGLLQDAAAMQGSRLPPDPRSLEAASACHRDFTRLRTEALRLAGTLSLSLPSSTSQDLASLDDLEAFLSAIAEAEVDWTEQEATRQRALEHP